MKTFYTESHTDFASNRSDGNGNNAEDFHSNGELKDNSNNTIPSDSSTSKSSNSSFYYVFVSLYTITTLFALTIRCPDLIALCSASFLPYGIMVCCISQPSLL